MTHPAGAGVVGGGREHPIAAEHAVELRQVGGAQGDIALRQQQLVGVIEADLVAAGGFPRGGGHQLHQAGGAGVGAGVGHEGAFLSGDGVNPGRVQLAGGGLGLDRLLVGHREADIQVVPMLRQADAADRREVPFHLPCHHGLGNQLFAAEYLAHVVPLAAGIHHLATGIEFLGPTYAGGLADPGKHGRIDLGGLVTQGIGLIAALGGEKAVEVTLVGQVGILFAQLAHFRAGQLGTA